MARIVVKVGSAVLTEQNRIAKSRLENLVAFLAEVQCDNEVILVSSGAVAAGYTELPLDKKLLANRQALASIGQPLLMHRYKRKFEAKNILVSQILVTAANFETPEESQRLKNTVDALLSKDVIPIVNENDATATAELVLGDNDQLSAYAAYRFNADILVILSDIDAYYDKDPHNHDDAKVLKIVHEIDAKELEKEVCPHNTFATGGIVTKLKAADYLLKRERKMFLASGFDLSDVKSFLLENRHNGGTLFMKRGK